jgi:hypothetical protein
MSRENFFTFAEIRGLIWHAERSGRDGMNNETKSGLAKLKTLLPIEEKQKPNENPTIKPTPSRNRSKSNN